MSRDTRATVRTLAAIVLAAFCPHVPTDADAQVIFTPILGGLPADSGLAAGAELLRYRTVGPLDARGRFIVSYKKYEHAELSLELPPPATNDFFADIRLRYRNYPEEDFWGLGSDTPETARTNYRLEDVWLTGTAGLHFRSGLRLAGILGRTEANVAPGRDQDFPSTETGLPPAATPGLAESPDYWRTGVEISFDRRDSRDDTRRGFLATFEWSRFRDDAPGDFSFDRYQAEYRQYFSLSDARRIGARARITLTDPLGGHVIPFYLQPFIGGTDTVRGYDQYRFRSGNAILFNVEYRQGFKSILDLIVFADAGRVADTRSDLGLTDLRGSAGVGSRVRLGDNVLFGADVGFSPEGTHWWFRSSHTF